MEHIKYQQYFLEFFPIIIDEEEWEKACCITCMEIRPGARNVIKGKS